METLRPSSLYFSNLNLSTEESMITQWTREENKKFEKALAIYDEKTPDRWLKVAAMIPGKSVLDVMRQYEELAADVSDIEAGLVPIPGYFNSPFTLDMVDNRGFDLFRKRPLASRSSDQERKKGVPWTEDEHRRFLMGLEKYGKGDWRNISRNFVISKTPTQVASHAQKYFIRQNLGGKDKRRPSIHDITTVHLSDAAPARCSGEPPSLDESIHLAAPHKSPGTPKILINWKKSNDGAVIVLDPSHHSPLPCWDSQGLKLQRGVHVGTLNSLLQMQPAIYQIHG